jgi:glyoxylase-like metal-dependent hydrolase (beta-lactamase superfamily II)
VKKKKKMIHTLDLHFLGHTDTIASYLIETSAGPVLIESGPYSTFSYLRQAVEAKGYNIKDIQHVFLTHIHLDHAGAAWAFAENGANIYVHPFGAKHMHDPSKLMQSATRIYGDEMERLWSTMKGIPKDQLIEVPHEASYTVGDTTLKAWHTPGHAVHHIAWQVGGALFTGDVAGVKIPGGIVVPPCPPPDINVEDWQASIALIKKLDIDTLYLTHYDKVTDIMPHLEQLEQRLLSWANWMRPRYEAGEDPETITPQFQEFAKQELIAHGIKDEEGLARYESANPSWMSVAGLLRYWRKKLTA